jgi:tetratricopeptide (TPR) repeat protein
MTRSWFHRLFTILEFVAILVGSALAAVRYIILRGNERPWLTLTLLIAPIILVRTTRIVLRYIIDGRIPKIRSWVTPKVTPLIAAGVTILIVVGLIVYESVWRGSVIDDHDAVAGREALEHREGAKALEAFRKLETRYPENGLVHFWLGRSYGMLRENSKAIRSYERSIQIDASNALAWMYLGTTLNSVDPQRSIDAAIKATDLAPDLPDAWYLLGLNYLSQKKPELAVAPLERAVQLEPEYAQAWSSLSTAYLLVGDSRSIEARTRAQSLEPKK